ncbi:MAG: methylenetetrahydrofolate reductase C-terminal domain-containing protein [Candidatus Hodarchaeota archaeon]
MVIITTKKPLNEILNVIEGHERIAIISCGSCAALCQTGGTESAKEMEEILKKEGYKVIITLVSEDVCDNRVMKKDLRRIDADISNSDAILTLSCGLGTQSITEVIKDKYPNMPIFVSTNTEFMGMTERIGRFYMRCLGCGDCLLNETAGICPITTCAKSLMNGPCGGQVKGKCEVGNYEKDCGWILIYNRLKELGRLDAFSKLRKPRDWKETGHQRVLVWR